MASKARKQSTIVAEAIKLPVNLGKHPRRYDWYAALLQLEAHHPNTRRIGELGRLTEEYIRLGQRPTVQFAAQTIAAIDKSTLQGGSPWLMQYFFGVFGSNGPLPLHLTEYAIEQEKYHGDPVFARFVNLFQHRLLGLFYRNWRLARPATDFSGAADKGTNFATKLQRLAGTPETSHGDRSLVSAEQAFIGLLSAGSRNTESLVQVLTHFAGAPVRVCSLVPSWLTKDEDQQSRLGRHMSLLGRDLQLGKAVLSVQSRVHIEVGPLDASAYAALLPDAPRGMAMSALVHKIIGYNLNLSVQLLAVQGLASRVGQMRLGYNSWLGSSASVRRGCTLYPGG